MADLRTPAERRYDELKDGSAYTKSEANQDDILIDILTDLYGDERQPEPASVEDDTLVRIVRELIRVQEAGGPVAPANPSPQLLSLIAWAEQEITAAQAGDDDELTPDEATIISIILRRAGHTIPIVRSRDAAHREERWQAILEKVAALDEPDKSEMIGYMSGLLDGMQAKGE